MEANLQYLPSQIKVSYQLSNAPPEVATLHTCSVLKALVLETADGKRRNIQHFHNHYLRKNNIISYDLGGLGHEAKLGHMTITEGERATRTLGVLLATLDPANLHWVGKINPAIDIIKDMLEEINTTKGPPIRATLVERLMDYLAKPETAEFVERYPTFKACIIDKCNQLRLLHYLDYPKVAAKCLVVLGVLGGAVTPLSREQLEALAHAPAPALAMPPVPPVPDAQVLENLRTLIPGHTRLILGICSYGIVEGVLSSCSGRNYIYSAKHKNTIPIIRFFNSYVKANGIVLEKKPKNLADVLKYFFINEQAYDEGESLYYHLLHWRPHLLTCLHIQTPEAFETELAQKKAQDEEYQRQEDEWRARTDQEEEVEGPCDCYQCSEKLRLENEIQTLQKRVRRLEEFIGFDG